MSERKSWYLVHTRPHSERKAAEHLGRQGIETYLPRYLRRTRHARPIDMVAAPLCPRYLFVDIDIMTQRWLAIRSTLGVSDLGRNGDSPAEVPGQVILGLRRREVSEL